MSNLFRITRISTISPKGKPIQTSGASPNQPYYPIDTSPSFWYNTNMEGIAAASLPREKKALAQAVFIL